MTTKDKIIEILKKYEDWADDERINYKRCIFTDDFESLASELAELKAQDKEVTDEYNSDPMCFHECPMCQTRCNCDTVYCTHCEEEEIKSNK